MTVGSLFAGIGGLDLGLERAGMRVLWQVEHDPYCERVLARHWPDVLRRRDVRLADATVLPRVDLICGGFPCQDISSAGKGAGLNGRRSGLWWEFHRFIGELRPRWVVIENVPALRTRGADAVLGALAADGYACWPIVVGVDDVGGPHRRKRVFVVGRLADAGRVDAAGRRGRRDVGGAARGAEGEAHQRERVRDAVGDGGARWPARPGEPQYDWEAPRTTESGVGRATDGLPRRLARVAANRRRKEQLKALGNAVVPQVAEVIGRAIVAVEAAAREGGA